VDLIQWPRARVGIYLGKSPRHARNVGLVLDPMTGMVSPQFQLRFDNAFETIRGVRETSHGTWRTKCYFSDAPVPDKTTKKLFKTKEKEKER
jgi:hypothetical protein